MRARPPAGVNHKRIPESAEGIEAINKKLEELDAKEKKGSLTADEQALRTQLLKKRDDLKEEVKKDKIEQGIENIFKKNPPPPEIKKSDYEQLSDAAKKAIKKIEDGIRIGPEMTIKPDFDFDIPNQKLKKGGVIFEWDF